MADTTDKVIIQYESHNFDKAAGDVKALSGNLEGLTEVSFTAEKSTASLENKFASLERRFQTTAAQSAQYEKIQKDVNLAVANNPALQARANDVLAAAEARFRGVGKATEGAAKQTGLAGYELTNVGRQIQDIFVSLTSGQSPVTVAIQQGTQLGDVYANTKGTMAGVAAQFGGMTTAAAAFVSPALAASVAMGGISAVAIAAGVHWSSAQKDVENALKGIGKQSGATVSDINAIAESTAKSTNLTIGSAREFATVFAATGKIGKDNIALATQAVDGLAHSLGVDGADAVKLLAGALADPAKGLAELEAKTGAYDLKTQDLIQSLVRQGEVQQAQAILIQGVANATKDAADKTGFWAARLKDLKDGFDLVGGDVAKTYQVGKYLAGGDIPASLSKRDQLGVAQSNLSNFDLAGKLDSANGAASPVGQAAQAQEAYAAYAKLLDKVNELKAAAREEAIAPLNKALKESASAADAAVNSFVPQIQKIRETEDAIKALTKAKEDQAIAGTQVNGAGNDAALLAAQNQLQALKDSATEAVNYNQQLAETSQAWEGVSQKTAMALQASENQRPVIEAIGGSAQRAAQYAADYANAILMGKTAADASALAADKLANAEAAAAKSVKERVIAAQKSVKASEDNLELLKAAGTADEARVKAGIAYDNAISSGASSSQAAAISANTLAAETIRAANASVQLAENFENAARAAKDAQFTDPGGSFGDFTPKTGQQYTSTVRNVPFSFSQAQKAQSALSVIDIVNTSLASGGLDAAIRTASRSISTGGQLGVTGLGYGIVGNQTVNPPDLGTLSSLYELKNAQTNDKGVQLANDQEFLTWLQAQPQTIANLQAINTLTSQMQSLANSTDSLNSTMKDALSPYYSQDPRTSHIGFRSQGMATGGELTVPGGYSANDNMIAQIPVASGEIVSVRRPGQDASGKSSQTINITVPITINGNANKDEVGRTVYQAMQAAGRQLQAASR